MWFKIFKLLTWDSKKQTNGLWKDKGENAEDEKATTELSQNNTDLKQRTGSKKVDANCKHFHTKGADWAWNFVWASRPLAYELCKVF